jgi:hypothetical protein
MLASGVITMPVLPVAVPFTVRVARSTLVAPTGICCDMSTDWSTICPAGTAELDFRLAQSGNATAVIVAIDGSLRVTVIRKPESPPGAESRTIGMDTVSPADATGNEPVARFTAATPGASMQKQARSRATPKSPSGRS